MSTAVLVSARNWSLAVIGWCSSSPNLFEGRLLKYGFEEVVLREEEEVNVDVGDDPQKIHMKRILKMSKRFR